MYLNEFNQSVYTPPPAPENWDVDCSVDPYDLRPAVKAIMTAENWIFARMKPGQKLVILVGEVHNFQTHLLLHKAILRAHTDQLKTKPARTFAFGFEAPHDFGEVHGLNRHTDPHSRTTLELFMMMEREAGWHSFDGLKSLFDYCLKENISVRFNDVSDRENDQNVLLINQEDPFTRGLVKKYMRPLLDTDILRIVDAEAIALSNLGIVRKAAEHIKDTGAAIYIQQSGMAHVMGNQAEKLPFKDSLAARFREKGFVVMQVMPTFEKYEKVIPRQARDLDASIRIRNLAFGRDEEVSFRTIQREVGMASRLAL